MDIYKLAATGPPFFFADAPVKVNLIISDGEILGLTRARGAESRPCGKGWGCVTLGDNRRVGGNANQTMIDEGALVDRIELRGNTLYFTIIDPDGNVLMLTGRLPLQDGRYHSKFEE